MVEYGFEDSTGGPGISENLLQVNVYFKSLNVRTVVETPVYEKVISRILQVIAIVDFILNLYRWMVQHLLVHWVELYLYFWGFPCQ